MSMHSSLKPRNKFTGKVGGNNRKKSRKGKCYPVGSEPKRDIVTTTIFQVTELPHHYY